MPTSLQFRRYSTEDIDSYKGKLGEIFVEMLANDEYRIRIQDNSTNGGKSLKVCANDVIGLEDTVGDIVDGLNIQGSQTPWTDNIDAYGYSLTNVNEVCANSIVGIDSICANAFYGDGSNLTNLPGGSVCLSAMQWNSNHTSTPGPQYQAGDIVYDNGNIYKAKFANDSIVTSNATYWCDLGPGERLVVDGRDLCNVVRSVNGCTGDVTVTASQTPWATDVDAYGHCLYDVPKIQGCTTLELVPNPALYNICPAGAFGDCGQYVVIEPTSPGHIHVRAGGPIDCSASRIVLGGESANVTVQDQNTSYVEDHTVLINTLDHENANTPYQWKFCKDGRFQLPSGGSIVDSSNNCITVCNSTCWNGLAVNAAGFSGNDTYIPVWDDTNQCFTATAPPSGTSDQSLFTCNCPTFAGMTFNSNIDVNGNIVTSCCANMLGSTSNSAIIGTSNLIGNCADASLVVGINNTVCECAAHSLTVGSSNVTGAYACNSLVIGEYNSVNSPNSFAGGWHSVISACTHPSFLWNSLECETNNDSLPCSFIVCTQGRICIANQENVYIGSNCSVCITSPGVVDSYGGCVSIASYCTTVAITSYTDTNLTANGNLNLCTCSMGTGCVNIAPACFIIATVPTSDPAITGAIWNCNGCLMISAGP